MALVEGPSDAIVLERAFRDATGKWPRETGIDIISMNGLTFRRALEVCAGLGRQAVALRDNDHRLAADLRDELNDLLAPGQRDLLVSDPAGGSTLEPQLITANSDEKLRLVLGLPDRTDMAAWMRNNKTEAALRILDCPETLAYPEYIAQAVELLK